MRNRLITLALLAMLLLTACRAPARPSRCPFEEGTVQVGVLLSDSGSAQAASAEQLRGYELALAEINAQGGVMGCRIEVVFGDDGSDPARAAEATQALARESRAMLLIGAPAEESTMTAAGVAAFYQTPLLVPAASDERLTAQGNEWLFRLSAPSSTYAAAALDVIEEYAGPYAAVAVVYEDSLFGQRNALPFASGAEARGLQIAAYERYPAGALAASGVITRLQQSDFDVLYFAAQADDTLALLEQCQGLDINPALYVGNIEDSADLSRLAADARAEGLLLTVGWHQDWPFAPAAAFANAFESRYHNAPTTANVQAYTAFYVAREALRIAAEDRRLDWQDTQAARLAVRDALRALELETALGTVRFDASGQNGPSVALVQIIGGQAVTVYPPALSVQPPALPVPPWSERP